MNIKKLLFRTNKKQLVALITICIVYGMHGTVFNSIPFMFYRPDIMCMKGDQVEYKCTEEEMCRLKKTDSTFTYRFEAQNNIRSIPIEYDLFCERKVMEASMQTLSTLGQLCGFILSFIWNIPTEKKFKVILINLYVESACLLSLMVFDSLFYVNFALFAQNFCFSYFYALLFVFASEYFCDTISDAAPILTNFLWAFTMIIYITYAYYNVYWRTHLSQFTGIPLLIMTGIFHYYTSQAPKRFEGGDGYTFQDSLIVAEEESSNQGNGHTIKQEPREEGVSVIQELLERMREIKNDKQQFQNLIVYMICNAGCYVSYFGVYLALNRLEGNLYVNSSVSTLFELSGGISAAILVSRFKHKQILFYTYILIGFSYISCLFFQNSKALESFGILGLILSILPIIVSKATHEMLFPIFILYLPKLLKQKYHQFAFAAANLIGVMTMNVLPFYQYFMEMYEINQFVGYGIFMFLVVFQIGKIVELDNGEALLRVKESSTFKRNSNSSENNSAHMIQMENVVTLSK